MSATVHLSWVTPGRAWASCKACDWTAPDTDDGLCSIEAAHLLAADHNADRHGDPAPLPLAVAS